MRRLSASEWALKKKANKIAEQEYVHFSSFFSTPTNVHSSPLSPPSLPYLEHRCKDVSAIF